MKTCKTCPTDITGRTTTTKFCSPCAKERVRARAKRQKKKRICKHGDCGQELINPKIATKYCTPCAKIRRVMTNKLLLEKKVIQEAVKPSPGETVAAKIADAVAKDKSYCMDGGSPYC